MKIKSKQKVSIILLFVLMLLCCGFALMFAGGSVTASASSNTDINDISMVEYTNHTLTNSVSGLSSYTEQPSRNSGIRIYSSDNSGSLKYNSTVKVDSNSVYVDFRNAVALYIPKAPEGSWGSTTYYDKTYKFEILSGSTVKWKATYKGWSESVVTGKDDNGNDVKTTYYKKDITINNWGSSTTSTESSTLHFSPRDFGNNLISLTDGTYTVRITRSYHWQYYKSWISVPKYESTSTQTGTLIIDTVSPTLTMRGNSSGSSISDGANVKESVTFSAYDTNHYRLYYKTPSSSSYTYTTSKTYVTGSANGWYYAYAEDTHGHRSPTYSVYYDNVLPVGTMKSNGSTITSGTTLSKSFSYTVTDSGSGINGVYYQTPVNSSYVAYTQGTIIPASAGDGWYYFYATDKSGNRSNTMSVCLDTTKPTVSLKGYSSGSTIQSGANVKERVTVTANDTHFSRLYYKTPGSSSFTSTTSSTYTSGTTNGLYEVYAVDTVGNKSEKLTFYYDNIAPAGKVYSNGAAVTSGAYISKNFSYSATDGGSGIAALYCKTPVSGTYLPYAAGTVITSNSGDGWYYFYAVDKVGNQSATTSVYLETQAPLVEIYRNGELAYSKTITGAGSYDTDIYLNPNDTLKICCDTSSGHVTSNYSLDTNITIGNAYPGSNYTIDITSATGIASHFTYHIVRNKPTVVIDGKTYKDGETIYLNSDKAANFVCDSVIKNYGETGVIVNSEGNVNLNEHISFVSGKGKTLTTAAGTETKYILHLNDRAGNESVVTVFIDKLAASGVWKSDGKTLANNGYTNKPVSFNFTEAGVTATYSYNGGEYQPYTSGTAFTADGTYIVVLTDLAKNKSNFTAHIDTVPPVGQLYANYKPVANGTVTSERIYMSWDGDITATVNGEAYTKNSVLSEDSVYRFILTDLANNSTDYVITIDTVAPAYNMDKLGTSVQLISKWYVATIGEKQYSFADYDEALAFACNNEFKQCVTVLVLNDVADFKQHHLVANGDEIREGEYWLYKSKANPDSLLYYFDRKGLDEVIAHYAKSNVSKVNYFVLDDDNVYGEVSDSMNDNVFTAPDGTKAPILNGFVFDKVDGSELFAELVGGDGTRIKIEYGVAFNEQVNVGGLYKFVEVDEAGNETEFYGFMDVLAPELKADVTVIGEETPTEMLITKDDLSGIAAYYYKRFAVNGIIDADTWAVLVIENDGKTLRYTHGDELPCLQVGGEYTVSLYDRLGNGYSFTVYIIGNPATIAFENNGDDTAFDITITLEQKFDTVVSLEIYKNGKALKGVTTDKLQYAFDRTGVYKVILRDNFGRVIEQEYTFNKALPTGMLEGVISGSKTKTDVTFTYDNSKYTVTVTKDGKAMETENSGKLLFVANDTNSGKYDIRLTRISDEENFTDYAFVINTLASDFNLSVTDGATTNKNVTVSWTATDIVSVTYSLNGGKAIEIENGAELTAEGKYVVIATNDLETQSEKTFVIDRTLDYDVLINNAETVGIDTTSGDVTVINNEPLYVSVTRNGEPYEFKFGQVLSDEGVYLIRISDDYNNSTSFTVVIDKSVDVKTSVGNGVISNEDVVISAGEKVNLIAAKDGVEYSYAIGTAIADEGSYKFTVYDSYGNEKSISFQIVKGTKTKLDYTLGDSVEIKSIDRDGEAVSADGNRLNFTVDGTYTVVCKSEGEEYTFTLSLDTTAPTIVLNGIEDGGKGNVTVTITDLSEAGTVEVYKDGQKIEYNLGDELKEYASYEVRVSDELGNERTYKFILEYQMNGGAIALIVIGILAAVGVVIAIIFGKKAVYKKKFKNAPKLTDEELAEEEFEAQTDENTDEDSSAE